MTERYGRLTGRHGVCLATPGPCAINPLRGTTDETLTVSHWSRGAQVGLNRIYKEPYQDVHLISKPAAHTLTTAIRHATRQYEEEVGQLRGVARLRRMSGRRSIGRYAPHAPVDGSETTPLPGVESARGW